MTPSHILIAYLMALVLAQAVFAAFPGIDIAVSALFHTEGRGFTWGEGPAPTINLVIRRISEIVAFALLAAVLFGLVTGKFRRNTLSLVAYPALCAAVAAGVIVNLLFKAQIGRARPADVVEFGGAARFTPAWQVDAQCLDNCSFTSGETALAASLAIPLVVILWPHLSRNRGRAVAVAAAALYIGIVSLLRIGLGRHFLSDTIFSVLIAGGAALALYPILRIAEARLPLPLFAFRKPFTELAEQRGVF